jgi:hypothetical protein
VPFLLKPIGCNFIRQSFTYGWGYINYSEMNRLMKFHPSYKALPAKVSQQILMILDNNWKSFFEAVKADKTDIARSAIVRTKV